MTGATLGSAQLGSTPLGSVPQPTVTPTFADAYLTDFFAVDAGAFTVVDAPPLIEVSAGTRILVER
jgi:hypothetical protein